MSSPQPYATALSLLLEQHLSPDRLSTYVIECTGRLDDAIELYTWNSAVTAAFWEQLGYVEVVMRNTLDGRLGVRHTRRGRPGTWLDDPARELTQRAREDVATARTRVIRKGKPPSHGQVVSELPFGFWRFLVSRAYSGSLWPDLASGFPHAPNRRLATVERPVKALHEFRNRLGHHQRIWAEPLLDRFREMAELIGYVDPTVALWVARTSRVQPTLALRP